MKMKWITGTILLLGLSASTLPAQNAFIQHNLVSDLPGLADHTDTNLVNPWGISFSATSPFWISDNGTGLSTLYNGSGAPISLIVMIPPPAGGRRPPRPRARSLTARHIFNSPAATTSKFLFDTEDGTISAWASGGAAILEVDNSTNNAVYKALALGAADGSNFLYATDFHNGQIAVINGDWQRNNVAGFLHRY